VQLTFQNSFEEQKTFQSCSLFTSGCFNVQIKIGMIYLNAYKNKLLLSRDQDGTFEKKNVIRLKGCIWEKARSMIQGEKIFDPN